MKKWKMLLLIALMTIGIPYAQASSNDVDYDIKNVYISADVDIVGSMHIKEAIVIKGTLNGLERNITYQDTSLEPWEPGKVDFGGSSFYNARGLKLAKISAQTIDKKDIGWDLLSIDYETFTEQSYAYKGERGVYTASESASGLDVRCYYPSDGNYTVYYYEYYVDQVAVLHNERRTKWND